MRQPPTPRLTLARRRPPPRAQPPTFIFELTRRFKVDSAPSKLNLGVGAYRDESLQPVVWAAVRAAEAAVVAARGDKEYLPIAGLPEFRSAAAALLFGASGPGAAAVAGGRVATAQSLSGTGALTLGAHLLRRALPGAAVYVSDPTWENHGKVLIDAGAGEVRPHRYWDAAARALDINGMLADLAAMPRGSVVLLHACAHNPTGVDPTREQWAAIADVMAERALLPWFDSAYQGFASGDPEEDAWAVRYFLARGFEMLVCQSFAKNFGLYCERVGALHVVAADAASAAAALSHVENIVRPMYSNPPAHGARVVAAVLRSPELRAQWLAELAGAMTRVKRMRELLRAALEARGTPGGWAHVTEQRGMFSYTGLTREQSERMVEDFHVYMLPSGRVNMAGLSEATVPVAADAIHAVVTGAPAPGKTKDQE